MPISWMSGLRMDGIPALDLWNLVIEVFRSSPNQSYKTRPQRVTVVTESEPRTKPEANRGTGAVRDS